MTNIYVQNGFENRTEYLQSLADDYNIEYSTVTQLAMLLGSTEDFDGLVSMVREYVGC